MAFQASSKSVRSSQDLQGRLRRENAKENIRKIYAIGKYTVNTGKNTLRKIYGKSRRKKANATLAHRRHIKTSTESTTQLQHEKNNLLASFQCKQSTSSGSEQVNKIHSLNMFPHFA